MAEVRARGLDVLVAADAALIGNRLSLGQGEGGFALEMRDHLFGRLDLVCQAGDGAGIDVALDARYIGEIFDDDLNTRRLDDYFVLNASVTFALDRRWSLYVRGENVLGDRYEVARTADGLTTYGPAAIVLAGVRFRVGE